MALGLLVKHAALWQSARHHLGELVPGSCVNDWPATCSYYASTGGRNLLLWQWRHEVSWMNCHTCAGWGAGAGAGGLLHIVTHLSGRLNENFSGLFVQCDTRGCACTSTLWAIKPFNGLNAVHKTPHCVWIYSLNCNTRRKSGEAERARMRKHVHVVCTRGGYDSVPAQGIRAYKLFTFALCIQQRIAHCHLDFLVY